MTWAHVTTYAGEMKKPDPFGSPPMSIRTVASVRRSDVVAAGLAIVVSDCCLVVLPQKPHLECRRGCSLDEQGGQLPRFDPDVHAELHLGLVRSDLDQGTGHGLGNGGDGATDVVELEGFLILASTENAHVALRIGVDRLGQGRLVDLDLEAHDLVPEGPGHRDNHVSHLLHSPFE